MDIRLVRFGFDVLVRIEGNVSNYVGLGREDPRGGSLPERKSIEGQQSPAKTDDGKWLLGADLSAPRVRSEL